MKDEGGWLADREQADREITAIIYLNNVGEEGKDWPEEHGGALRCYLGARAVVFTAFGQVFDACLLLIDCNPGIR